MVFIWKSCQKIEFLPLWYKLKEGRKIMRLNFISIYISFYQLFKRKLFISKFLDLGRKIIIIFKVLKLFWPWLMLLEILEFQLENA